MQASAKKKNWRWSGGELELPAIAKEPPFVKTPGINLVSRRNTTLLPKEEEACAKATD